jgi:putative ABC transport system permease protein
VNALLFRASARHFMRHPWQLVLAVAGVALGVAIVVAVGIANTSARRAFELSMERVTGAATHQIVGGPAGIDEGVYIRLRLLGVRASAPAIEAFGKAAGETIHLLGVDPFAEGGFRRHLAHAAGTETAALIARPNTALLAAPTARRLGLRPGDTLAVRIGGRDAALDIVGLIPPDHAGAAAIDGLLVVDIATAQALTGMQGRLSWIDLRLDRGADTAPDAIRRLLPAGAELLPARSRLQAMEQMTRAFHVNLTAMSLLALVVGLFLIYNTMSFAVVQRRGAIACLRLIGVSRREIVRTVLLEASAIGAAATLLGLVAGTFLGQSLLALVTRTINDLYFVLAVTGLRPSPGPLLLGASLGLLGTALAALAPALEASLTDPRAALQRSALESRSRRAAPRLAAAGVGALTLAAAALAWPSRSIALAFVGLFLFALAAAFMSPLFTAWLARALDRITPRAAGIASHLAIRGIGTALSRTGVALAALMLAVATSIGVGIMIESFRATVSDWLEASLQADIYVSAPGLGGQRASARLDPGTVGGILALPMIRAHSTGRTLDIESNGGSVEVFVLGLSDGSMPRYPLTSGRPEEVWPRFRRGEAVLVSEPLAYRRRIAAGDTLELRTDRGPRRLPVAAVYRDYSSSEGEVLMPRALYDRYFDDAGISGLGLYLEPGASLDDALAAVRAAVAAAPDGQVLNVRSNRELRELSLRIFDRTFTVTEVLRLLAVIVAMIGVVGSLMALQLERSAEIGLLRALGFTRGQVYALALTQTGAAGVIAGLIALPTGIALALLLIRVINVRSFGWTMDALVPFASLAGGIAAAVAAALFAGLYPAWKASRASPAAVLRNE